MLLLSKLHVGVVKVLEKGSKKKKVKNVPVKIGAYLFISMVQGPILDSKNSIKSM